MELQKQMYDPEGDFFQEAIWPLTVQTMQLVVGAPSLQFKFVNDSGKVYTPDFHFDLHQKVFKAPQGKNLYHMTIGVKSDLTPASTRDWKNYLNWEIPERTFSSLNPVKPYYLYAKCNKNGHTGSYELSETIISLEQESGYYHFWVGFLNSQYEGERSFRTVYGFTEISGGNVTADKLISAGGDSYIHLDENTMHLGDSNSYLDYKDGVTSLKGVVIQSPSGDESPLGAYRGAYRSGTVYYVGDEVTYNGSTYRCMRQGSNIAPPNATYWQVLAAGGTKVEFRYAANTSSTSYPSISTGSRSPSGWSTTPPTLSTTQYLWMTQATINPDDTLATNWSIPVRSSGIKGDKGDTGAPGATGPTGPALNYRGDWVNTEAYELTTLRRDIVRYKSGNSHVYYARAGYTGSTPSGTAITNTNYWQSFGANFESLATGLLFAGKALISGWNFNDNFIWSQHRKCVLNGSDTSNQSTTPILLIGDEALNENLALNPNCAMKVSQNGTITVGEGTSDSNAGITGQGNEPDNVRFWAGATYNNRNSSPFRVTQDGSMVASNAKIQSNTSGNKIIIDPTTRSIRMLASVGNIELEVCKIDFFINGSNSGSTLRLNSYSGSSLRSYTQITGQYVSICDSSGLEFFRADAINEKIWINYHKLPQSRDAAYPREVYMDGETVKVKRT